MENEKRLDHEQLKKVSGGNEIIQGQTPGVCPSCGSSFCGYWIRINNGREQKVWFCNICSTEFTVD